METNLIDFVPTENFDAVALEAREWLLANAFMGLNPDRLSTRDLSSYDGGRLYLELGGYVADPEHPGHRVPVEASLIVDVACEDEHRDPEGTIWYTSTLGVEVNWSSYGSMGPKLSRMRATMIDAAVQLAERFAERFAGTTVWTKGMTQAERDAWILKLQQDATRLKVASTIREAIHTTCRGMRVGNERFVPCPPNLLSCEHVVTVEGKTYKAIPSAGPRADQLYFMRTK